MNPTDKKILKLLQDDASMPVAEIAAKVHLSAAPCWRRIQKLKDAGVIRKHVALCDAKKLAVGVTVFVSIKTSQHNAAWFERFARGVADIPEVVEFYRMSGDIDYLLRVVVPDIDGYGKVYAKMIERCEFLDISASFALEAIKHSTALPLHHLP